ncbi:hypothetical protein [Paenibacillus tyrfis]|uniref:hypothetical protein n=1 Tax=Paenibacillus tyrfis TaxID=1501230 RepID=UPI00209C96CD|nr:hypothetical protein [Paenibacillus tyrfis]MCP1310908.1 hypothetical protein [Paenibacillus tyrfis]
MRRGIQILQIVVVAFFMSVSTAFASSSNEAETNQALEAATNAFEAMKAGNVNELIANTKDLNFNDESARRSHYEKSFQDQTVTSYQIISENKLNDNKVELKVKLTLSETGVLPVLPYSVVKENGTWMLQIEPLKINLENSQDYGKVSAGKPMETIKFIEPSYTAFGSVAYYSFDNLATNKSITINSAYSISKNQVTFHGWQTTLRSATPKLKYHVIKYFLGQEQSYGSAVVSGDIPQSGTWYSEVASVSSTGSNFYTMIENISNNFDSASGAGNVYE